MSHAYKRKCWKCHNLMGKDFTFCIFLLGQISGEITYWEITYCLLHVRTCMCLWRKWTCVIRLGGFPSPQFVVAISIFWERDPMSWSCSLIWKKKNKFVSSNAYNQFKYQYGITFLFTTTMWSCMSLTVTDKLYI